MPPKAAHQENPTGACSLAEFTLSLSIVLRHTLIIYV